MKNQFLMASLLVASCATKETRESTPPVPGTYAYDLEFLSKNGIDAIELAGPSGRDRLVLSADYQGRVFTSTTNGPEGSSNGWINYDLIASGQKNKQFNPVGGEERIWLGPEGGQYSLYFAPGDSFTITRWQVPPPIDTVAYSVTQPSPDQAVFSKEARLTNYGGTTFDIFLERRVTLLGKEELESRLGTTIPEELQFVGYETDNRLENRGADWKKSSGLISIWLLGMFLPSDSTTVIMPFRPSAASREMITTDYFGEIPADRLSIRDSVLLFKGDGRYRSKLGIPPSIAKTVAGSFDFQRNILTIILFKVDAGGDYVNSKWETQKEPYRGDAVNSYNDGPLTTGGQLGPFYEIESSSSVRELKKGESLTYRQTTCHFEGDYDALNIICRQLLGVDLSDVR